MGGFNGDSRRFPARRFRFDDRVARRFSPALLVRRTSGRRLVLAGAVGILLLWGVLYALFVDWRSRYRLRADFGAREVASAVDPLHAMVPPGVAARAWHQAVSRTHAMLRTVTALGMLDRAGLEVLRTRIRERVRRARPETAIAELIELWDEMEAGAGPITQRRRPNDPPPRPALLESPADAILPLDRPEMVPPGVPAAAWRQAVAATYARLKEASASGRIDRAAVPGLRARLWQEVPEARRTTALGLLIGLWDELDARGLAGTVASKRPAILGHPASRADSGPALSLPPR